MNMIDYKKIATDPALFQAFKKFFSQRFNTELKRNEYLAYIELCENNSDWHVNPLAMCAWRFNKPVDVVYDRFLEGASKNHV